MKFALACVACLAASFLAAVFIGRLIRAGRGRDAADIDSDYRE